jgi:phosphoglycolate phosphatase-like HAD superfamily hydrolase
MRQIKAVIFDLDGTIADTEGYHRQAWEITTQKYDLGVPGEEIFRASLGISSIKVLQGLLPEAKHARIPEIAETKFQITMDLLRGQELRILPGFVEAYRALLDRYVQVGICTSAREENVQALSESKGALPDILNSLQGRIVWKEMTARGKPAPEPLVLAMTLLGSPPADETVYVGDALADYACAQSVGVHYCHFTECGRPAGLPLPVKIMDNHCQLLEIFAELAKPTQEIEI